jgi:MFS transporter, YNFM family, putative membrane transport protein
MPAARTNFIALQALVFALVSAAFTAIYLVQPVLPVIRDEFAVDEQQASLAVSAVILGIALANLPFGRLSDRIPVRPLIAVGGAAVAGFGLLCAAARDIALLVGFRFLQGLFIPALTTCLAAYLARHLPAERLNVALGSYVAATVVGGLLGRLIGGFLHPSLHWRYAFLIVSVLVAAASLAALLWLPREKHMRPEPLAGPGFAELLARKELLRIYAIAFCAFFVFSALFNYLPFYLSAPPFGYPTRQVTYMYFSYLIGVVVAPLSGRLSNRLGGGATLCIGAAVAAAALGATHIPSAWTVAAGLGGVCAGFFAIHAAAVGTLNRRLAGSRGRANSLYVLFYYLGGAAGITLGGYGWQRFGWSGVSGLGLLLLAVIAAAGIAEMRTRPAPGRTDAA